MMQIYANVHQISNELEESLPEIRSLWFPSQRDIDDWNTSESTLYIRRLKNRTFEIGPRLKSLNAARLCPVIRGHLLDTGTDKTTLSGTLRFSRETEFLFLFWGLFILLWAASLWVQVGNGELPWGWWVWWGILTSFFISAITLGRIMGGHHLHQGLRELKHRIETDEGTP